MCYVRQDGGEGGGGAVEEEEEEEKVVVNILQSCQPISFLAPPQFGSCPSGFVWLHGISIKKIDIQSWA